MNQAANQAVIEQYTKSLKLPTIAKIYSDLSRQATADGWPYEDYLKQLLEAEILHRQDKAIERCTKQAMFPDIKTVDQLKWDHLKGVSKPKILELASCQWLEQAQDVVLAGPIGTGKTHLAIALGVEAAKRCYRVVFVRAADLVRDLIEAKDERMLGKLQLKMSRAHLLILDELGFVPFNRQGGELLFNLLAQRYEKRSTLITTNLAFSQWVEVFQSERLTAALLDRISHHGHIIATKGQSYRTKTRNKKSHK
jgi:DNA replication protein DnaC